MGDVDRSVDSVNSSICLGMISVTRGGSTRAVDINSDLVNIKSKTSHNDIRFGGWVIAGDVDRSVDSVNSSICLDTISATRSGPCKIKTHDFHAIILYNYLDGKF